MANIMIVGVGGQGTLLASRIIGNAVASMGCDVKVSEVHGMSQRGGSVVTYVRYSEKVASPIIEPGQADYILAFEELEALRWSSYLKKDGLMIVNANNIDPMPVITGQAKYPENIPGILKDAGVPSMFFDALAMAKEAGTEKAVNVVLVGALAAGMDIDKEIWENAIRATVKPAFIDVNLKAFQMGYEIKKA
ncbi:MAG: indolepyruvate oxidoreductase subunit beta [Clostridia bacterium]|nr:indolepyruvate oxidoreductase subunit beta [Clostridia bacterium]